MQREKRWCLRKPIKLDIALHTSQSAVIRCSTRDIGLEGLFVETDKHNINTLSEFDVTIFADEQNNKSHRIRAKVVHATDDGIGLMFQDHSIETIRFMRQIFYGHKD